MYKEHEKHCLECGATINYGRKDRHFCSDTCKNHYHNKSGKDHRNLRVKVKHALEKNYDILDNLVRLNIHSVDRADLRSLGYRDEYVTAYRKVGRRAELRCYDIKFSMTDNRISAIEKVPSTVYEMAGMPTSPL